MLSLIINLSRSQGFYGRMLRDIDEMTEEQQEEFWMTLENKNFKDSTEFINFIEGAE